MSEVQARRKEMRNRQVGDSLQAWFDEAGAGKGTNFSLAEREHTILFDKHKKAHEHATDDVTPEGYYHLKGGSQPRHDCCMEVLAEGEKECPEHGGPAEWPMVCPIYERSKGDSLRNRYEALKNGVGARKAHDLLGLEDCHLFEQFQEMKNHDRVVSVHEFHQVETPGVTAVDEKPREQISEQKLSPKDLERAAGILRDIGHMEMAQYVDEILEAVRQNTDYPDSPQLSEAELSEVKFSYNERLVRQIALDNWDGAKFCFDAILSSLGEREIIALPPTLDSCPRCGAPTRSQTECTQCYWNKETCSVLAAGEKSPRASSEVVEDEDGQRWLLYQRLTEMDVDVVLDATGDADYLKALFQTDEIQVHGDGKLDSNLNLTQIHDGQYHMRYIQNNERLQQKIQRGIYSAAAEYEKPLFGIRRDLIELFDWPDNAVVRYYGGERGMNYNECDAVVCIGAPHPNMTRLRRVAELICMDTPYGVGGEEFSDINESENPARIKKLGGHEVPVKDFTGMVGTLFRQSREAELLQFIHRIRPVLAEGEKDAYLLSICLAERPSQNRSSQGRAGRTAANRAFRA